MEHSIQQLMAGSISQILQDRERRAETMQNWMPSLMNMEEHQAPEQTTGKTRDGGML